MSNYKQPPQWSTSARYTDYIKDKVTPMQYLEWQKLRKELASKLPKLGEASIDELLLKIGSKINEKG